MNLRISVVHSFYRSGVASGENLAVIEQVSALEDSGADVRLVRLESDVAARGALGHTKSAIRVATGRDVGQRPPAPRAESEVLLVQNLFPNFGSRWIRDWPGPVVTMVHNYRYLCANGLLLRDGSPCVECLHVGSHRSLVHACYRDSRLATLPLALATHNGGLSSPPLRFAGQVVVQSERAFQTYHLAGVPRSRLCLVPGFTLLADQALDVQHVGRTGWVFAGRLTPEKGLRELLHFWPPGEQLDVAGDGPEFEQLRQVAPESVNFLGHVSHESLLRSLPGYEGLIFPGRCWEGAHPRVVREAMASGTPVAAAVGTSAADLVERSGGGDVFEMSSKSLLEALEAIRNGGPMLRSEARATACSEFGRSVWTARMLDVMSRASKHGW